MATTVRISSKHQIVIPREARETLHIGPGEELMVLVKENRIVLVPRPADFVARMAGLHKDVWDGAKGTRLLADERKSWDR